jgi:Pyruvate/2-oxoacid:ferredoxin oxidoreductase gamma subunit
MIALGFVLKHLDFISYRVVEELVKEAFAGKAKLIPLNLEALRAGYEYEA